MYSEIITESNNEVQKGGNLNRTEKSREACLGRSTVSRLKANSNHEYDLLQAPQQKHIRKEISDETELMEEAKPPPTAEQKQSFWYRDQKSHDKQQIYSSQSFNSTSGIRTILRNR